MEVVKGFPEADGSSGEKVEIRSLRVGDTVSEKEQRPHRAYARICEHVEAENVGDRNKEHTRLAL